MRLIHSLISAFCLLTLPVLALDSSSISSMQLAAKTNLKPVQTAKVCMVNDAVFTDDQIPVTVQGKTYYGCCNMCKGRLKNDAAIRHAVDPVSGRTVDKATAVIGADATGQVFYFENRVNFEKFSG